MGDLSGFQEETISGHKVIISNRRQDWATEANEQLAAGVFDVGSKAYFTSLLQMPLTSALIVLQIVIVLIVGAFLVIGGETTLGVVIAFTGYAALLSGPLSEIANLTGTTLTADTGSWSAARWPRERAPCLPPPNAPRPSPHRCPARRS